MVAVVCPTRTILIDLKIGVQIRSDVILFYEITNTLSKAIREQVQKIKCNV